MSEENISTSDAVVVQYTKNYKYGAHPYALKIDGVKDYEEFNANKGTLHWGIRTANRATNNLIAVNKKWHVPYNEIIAAQKVEIEAMSEEEDVKAARDRHKAMLSEWKRDNLPEMREDMNAAAKKLREIPGVTSYMINDAKSRVKLFKSKRFNSDSEGGSIYFQLPSPVPASCINDSDPSSRSVLRVMSRTGKRVAIRFIAGGTTAATYRYCTLSVNMHRPLPEGSVIKGFRVKAMRKGTGYKYEIIFCITGQEEVEPQRPGWVAVIPGWAEDGHTLKLASATDSEGKEFPIQMNIAHDKLVMQRISELNDEIDSEVAKRRVEVIVGGDWPEWLARKCRYITRCKSAYRLLDIVSAGIREGCSMPNVNTLKGLVNKRASLYNKQSNQRDNRSKQIASNLFNEYGFAGVPSTNYAVLKSTASKNKHQDDGRMRDAMTLSSPGMLRLAIERKFGLYCVRGGSAGLNASTEDAAKGQGVLDSINSLVIKQNKSRERVARMSEGRRKKAVLAKEALSLELATS